MIVMMEPRATESEIAAVVQRLTGAGCRVQRSGMERVALGVTGDGAEPDPALVAGLPGVADASAGGAEYRLVSREFRPENSEIPLGRNAIAGGRELVVIGGPCSVEDADSLDRVAEAVAAAGARGLRAGAYKPRSSPYSFQGLGEEGLYLLRQAADRYGLLAVSEVMEVSQIPLVGYYCDVVQVGARNMHNYSLLRELGRCRRPVLLKRGLAATLDEWLGAAEYIVSCGNPDVLLCERGIRTFETATRNTLDLSAVPVAKSRSHLPILVDPSHGTGRREHVLPMARAAVAAGADGLLIEVHIEPDRAISDGAQTITPAQFSEVMRQVRRVAEAVDRGLAA
jgi:3-deoxy-7-phosphoheptulonate synthase